MKVTFEILPNGLGVKSFPSKEVCDYAFEAQNKAYQLGYATKIIQRLGDCLLLMEVAETDWIMNNLKQGKYYDTVFVKMADALEPLLINRPFRNRPRKRYVLDFKRENLGIYQNKIVLIDFT